MSSGRSLMCSTKRVGPRIDPWQSPALLTGYFYTKASHPESLEAF